MKRKRGALKRGVVSGKLPPALIIAVAFGAIGSFLLFRSFAAGPFESIEPNAGTLTGNVGILADSNASGGTAIRFGAAPARYEAESATHNVQVVAKSFASGGNIIGWFDVVGKYVTFNVNAPQAGSYRTTLRYNLSPYNSSDPTSLKRTLKVNGTQVSVLNFPRTTTNLNYWDDASTYQTFEVGNLQLNQGSNTITFSLDDSGSTFGWDIDYLELYGGSAPTTPPTPPTNPPTPPPNPPGNSPSGEAMPVGDISGWRQVFTEEFTTDVPLGGFAVSGWRQGVAHSAYKSKWTGYPADWHDTSGNGWYDQSKVISVSGGMMKKFIHTEGGKHYVSAPVPLIPGATNGIELTAGRYVVRFKSDPIPGYKTAWLLWPESDIWPRDGEIDFPEGGLDGNISAFMHRQNGSSGSDQDYYDAGANYQSWHTAVIEWKAGQYCKFIIDGRTIGNSTSRVPSTPMHWVLQTETELSGTPSDSAQGNLYIDWVTVYVPN